MQNTKKLLEVVAISTTLIVVMVAQVYAYVQIHPNVHIKPVQCLYLYYISIKLFFLKQDKNNE